MALCEMRRNPGIIIEQYLKTNPGVSLHTTQGSEDPGWTVRIYRIALWVRPETWEFFRSNPMVSQGTRQGSEVFMLKGMVAEKR